MRGHRYKPVGWRGESHRHYLAAKGISTGNVGYLARKIKLYHGTSKDNIESIEREGLIKPFLSLEPKQAEWFGKHHGEPAIFEVQVDEDDLVAHNPFELTEVPINESDIYDDLLDEDEYIRSVEDIHSSDIRRYSAKKLKLYRGVNDEEAALVERTGKTDASKTQYPGLHFTRDLDEAKRYSKNVIATDAEIDEHRTRIGGIVRLKDDMGQFLEGDTFLLQGNVPAKVMK